MTRSCLLEFISDSDQSDWNSIRSTVRAFPGIFKTIQTVIVSLIVCLITDACDICDSKRQKTAQDDRCHRYYQVSAQSWLLFADRDQTISMVFLKLPTHKWLFLLHEQLTFFIAFNSKWLSCEIHIEGSVIILTPYTTSIVSMSALSALDDCFVHWSLLTCTCHDQIKLRLNRLSRIICWQKWKSSGHFQEYIETESAYSNCVWK